MIEEIEIYKKWNTEDRKFDDINENITHLERLLNEALVIIEVLREDYPFEFNYTNELKEWWNNYKKDYTESKND